MVRGAELALLLLLGCATGVVTDGRGYASCSVRGQALCTACLTGHELPTDPNAPLPAGCVQVEGEGLTGNAVSAITSIPKALARIIWPF